MPIIHIVPVLIIPKTRTSIFTVRLLGRRSISVCENSSGKRSCRVPLLGILNPLIVWFKFGVSFLQILDGCDFAAETKVKPKVMQSGMAWFLIENYMGFPANRTADDCMLVMQDRGVIVRPQ